MKSESAEQEQHVDLNQIKRQIVKLEKDQQLISKSTMDFKNASKKVLQNLENDSIYYVSHLKDIEHATKKEEKEKLEMLNKTKVANEIASKVKESEQIHFDLLNEQKKLVQDTIGIKIKPKTFETEFKDAEVGFEKYTNRYNNYRSVNATLRDKIGSLVKEKNLFETQNQTYTDELKNMKIRISQCIDGCNQNYEIREELKSKVAQLLEKSDKDKANFASEMLELERLIREKESESKFKEDKQEPREFTEIITQSKEDLKNEKDIQLLKQLEQFVKYLETFEDFKNTFIDKYEAREREINSMFTYICELYSHIDTPEETVEDLKIVATVTKEVETLLPIQHAKESEEKLDKESLDSLNACAALLSLNITLDNEPSVNYFIKEAVDPERYFSQIDYKLDKLTLLTAAKKAVAENSDEVNGSFKHNNSASTLSSEKPNGAKERLIIVNPPLLEAPHFSNKPFPMFEYFMLM